MMANVTTSIPGYTYGTESVARSPMNMGDLDMLKRSVQFTSEDEKYLRMAGQVLEDQVDDILDLWYSFIGSHPFLVRYFAGPDGKPNPDYLTAVRHRFGQWIMDTCNRPYDEDWLDYQYEIGLRHTRAKKNQTDGVESVPVINLRYILALIYPITATIRPFLAKRGHSEEEVDRMYQAWFKSVVLQVTLWTQPYVKEGDF